MWWEYLVCAAIGYSIGAIPAGLVVGRVAKGIDIRDYGSGKLGFTNALRTLGVRWGAVVLLADILKGVVPVVIALVISDEPWVVAVTGLAAAIGHDWPVYAGFHGGRGVATSYGAALAMSPLPALALLPVGIGVVATTRIMSLLSVGLAPVLALVFVVLAAVGYHPWAYAVYAVIAAAQVVVLHWENVRRLLAGTEPRIGEGGARRGEASEGTTT
ncbi:MAG: glycerol-3-phosphate 1-O-acyltransferase PlsY [Dehalococcoidia bacterium]